jgi:hypothetical protein
MQGQRSIPVPPGPIHRPERAVNLSLLRLTQLLLLPTPAATRQRSEHRGRGWPWIVAAARSPQFSATGSGMENAPSMAIPQRRIPSIGSQPAPNPPWRSHPFPGPSNDPP